MVTLIKKNAQEHYNKNWHLFGGRLLGEKAQKLYDTSLIAQEASFSINPRAVLAMEWTENLKNNQGKLNEKQMNDLNLILKLFEKHSYLAVRSSAYGDARGTGAHKSVYCKNEIKEIINAINEILDNENTSSVIAFRKDAGLNEGMAIIIEPLIGTFYPLFIDSVLRYKLMEMGKNIDESKIKDNLIDVFAPAISGFGYTSTGFGEGYIKFVFGLASLAVQGYGEIFRFRNIFGDKLDQYYFSRNKRHNELCARAHVIDENGELDNKRYVFDEDRENQTILDKADTITMQFKLIKLKESMEKLERLTGKKQYIEFASVMNEEDPHNLIELNYLTQIADIDQMRDNIEFPQNPKNVVHMFGDEIFGNEIVKSNGVFWASNEDSLNLLKEYNKIHKNYLLVLSAHNVSSAFNFSILGYENFNNMGAIAILGKIPYGGTVEGHIGGFLRAIKKPALHDNKIEAQFFIKNLLEKMKIDVPDDADNYPNCLNCDLEIIVSEAKGKGLITYLD